MVVWRWLATVSVSQNDNYAQCESPAEKSINTAEGTAGGALFRAVNVIADAIKDDYPGVAIDTLAYQWSRPAPKITKPRPNGEVSPLLALLTFCAASHESGAVLMGVLSWWQ